MFNNSFQKMITYRPLDVKLWLKNIFKPLFLAYQSPINIFSIQYIHLIPQNSISLLN